MGEEKLLKIPTLEGWPSDQRAAVGWVPGPVRTPPRRYAAPLLGGDYAQHDTQTIESFWSLLKRGIMGAFHHVSQHYLPFYLNEFTIRHNYRTDPHLFERVLIAG